MKKASMSLLTVVITVASLYCQVTEPATEEFKPSGSPIITIFGDFHITKKGSNDIAPGFDIKRAYLGYDYNFSTKWSGRVILDVGDVKDTSFKSYAKIAFPKNAFLNYKTGDFSLRFGLITLNSYSTQEKLWGYRYLYVPFMDKVGMAYSADYGIAADYKISEKILVDAMIINGEGFKKLDADSSLKLAAGGTFTIIKGLDFRLYYDFMNKPDAAQHTFSIYSGYKSDVFAFGGEFDYQLNNLTRENHDLYGFSVYSYYTFAKKYKVFGRFDWSTSSTLDGADDTWNTKLDGNRFFIGFEYIPVKGIRLAPNFQGWQPVSGDFESSIMLNFEVKL
jgi:hypothetical protein